MTLSDICIARPVLAIVMNVLIVLLGLVATGQLTTREYPNVDSPTVTVATSYPGASAETVETQITKLIEDQLSGLEGIDYITSVSRAEQSRVTVNFKLDRDPDAAASDVRDRVDRTGDMIPRDAGEPVISKAEADAQPIIFLAFSSDRHSALEITSVADNQVRDALQTLPGVADIQIFGERSYAMRIWLDAARLAALKVTVQDVAIALQAQNVDIPAGRLESYQREFTVFSQSDLQTVEQFQQVVLKEAEGYRVRLGDVARIEIAPASERSITRFNGKAAVSIGVIKQATANPLDVSLALQTELPRIRQALPIGMDVVVSYDSTLFITASIESVQSTVLEAIVLVVLVIFFFLRSARAVLIPLVTIPISLIGACALMALFGFSINVLTLLAFVLAIGLVVDDAIVVLENIYRHVERGLSPKAAALKGSREIAFAVVAMTITLASVFVPVAFTAGTTGRLFTEFALTLSAAVLISGVVALTLSPMMCSRLLSAKAKHGRLWHLTEALFKKMNDSYARALSFVLSVRWVVVAGVLVLGGANYVLFTALPSELSPQEDRGYFTVFATGPEGATVDYMDDYAEKIDAIIQSLPDLKQYFFVIGRPIVSNARAFIVMQDWDQRSRTTAEAAGSLRKRLTNELPGVRAYPINPQSLGGGRGLGQGIRMVIKTRLSYEELDRLVTRVQAEAEKLESLVNLDSDLKLNSPQLLVHFDRERLAAAGVDVTTVGRTLEILLGGRNVTRFKLDAEQYNVILQLEPGARRTPTDLSRLFVRNNRGEMVQLSNLVSLEETVAPRELNHFDKQRAVTLSANVGLGFTQGQALSDLEALVRRVADSEIQIDYTGSSREFRQASASLFIAFALALGFVYLVMAAQFESFIDPFIIMLSVPLALVGALLALTITGGSLNIYSQIGLISLVGLITKNGILVVEFANQLQEQGRSLRLAIIEAAVLRLRPVLMTAGSMVLGALPLALATGAGSESRQQIGWVVVGGMTLGTVFTLFVVPVVYSLMGRVRRPISLSGLEQEIAQHAKP